MNPIKKAWKKFCNLFSSEHASENASHKPSKKGRPVITICGVACNTPASAPVVQPIRNAVLAPTVSNDSEMAATPENGPQDSAALKDYMAFMDNVTSALTSEDPKTASQTDSAATVIASCNTAPESSTAAEAQVNMELDACVAEYLRICSAYLALYSKAVVVIALNECKDKPKYFQGAICSKDELMNKVSSAAAIDGLLADSGNIASVKQETSKENGVPSIGENSMPHNQHESDPKTLSTMPAPQPQHQKGRKRNQPRRMTLTCDPMLATAALQAGNDP